jgi:hypothetical protein
MINLENCKKCIHYRPSGFAYSSKCIECVNDQGRMPWYTPRPRTFSAHPVPPTDAGWNRGIEAALGADPVIVRVPREEASSLCEEAESPCCRSSGSVRESDPEAACDPGDSEAPRLADALREISEALGIPVGRACGEPACDAVTEPYQRENAERDDDRCIPPVSESVVEPGCTGSCGPGCGGGH